MPVGLSRRTLFAHIGAFCGLAAARTIGPAHSAETSPSRFFLTERKAHLLAVLCDRLIPEDDFPSASQAGVVDYIDLQLATAWGQGEGLYLQGPWQRGAPEQGYQLRPCPRHLEGAHQSKTVHRAGLRVGPPHRAAGVVGRLVGHDGVGTGRVGRTFWRSGAR